MLTKYGFVCAKFNGMAFDLNPTLEAMARIGNKEDIMQVFSKLHCITIREVINTNPYQHMIYHGMIGHTENKITSNRAGTTADFEPERFAELARLKLHMSRDEAWSLTMTEFISLWNTEYPPTDKQMDESITIEEYDDGIARLEAIRDKALRKNK